MSAKKKTAQKKTAAKKAAKVMIEVMSDVMDSIIERVSDITAAPEPVQDYEVFEEDDYNEFAPISAPKGWVATEKEAKLDREAQSIIMPPEPPVPAPVEEPSQPLPEPVATNQALDINELEGDALIVQRLINGINHLYGIARLTKGIKGPQPNALAGIKRNILAAKELIARLS